MLKVALRNRLNEQLTSYFSASWYDNAHFLALDQTKLTDSIKRAKNYIARARPPRAFTTPRLIAELNLSFWVSLLRPTYSKTLWPIIRHAFLKYTHRKSVMRDLEPLPSFRNRIAHHEPIHDRRPDEKYNNILSVAGMLDQGLPLWIEHHSRVRRLLTEGPIPPRIQF